MIDAIASDPECELSGRIDRGDPVPDVGDLVIDFSSDEGSKSALAASERHSAPLFIGTTALSQATHDALARRAREVPVMVASNASIGVAVMHRMAALAVRALGGTWSVRLTEIHHVRKLDAPSGTALALAETVRAAGGDLAAESIRSVREGDVVGHHLLEFIGLHETIRLSHEAHDRALFARGALTLALWLRGRAPGMHTIQRWLDERMNDREEP